MIVASSQFRVANGTQATVAEAFANRVGLVDCQPGFLGLEVFTAAGDDALFYLVTRWTDEVSFNTWHHSKAHRESHAAMPRGIKLEKERTRLQVMNRIASGAHADGLDQIAADTAPLVAEFLRGAGAAFIVVASADGAIRTWNKVAARCFGADWAAPQRTSLWECLAEEDTVRLRCRVESAVRRSEERFVLKLRGNDQAIECQLDIWPDGFVLLGEYTPKPDAALFEDMTRINNEVVELSRESARKGQALARALAEVEEKNKALEQAYVRITELARTDPLTGVCNRRHFDEMFTTESARARRQQLKLTVVMIDLDHFKSVNDRYGHGVGDAVLVAVASALKTHSRPYDIVARFGGEEFVLLLPGTTLDGGVECAERLRLVIAAMTVESYPHRITASLGIAMLAEAEDRHSVLARADAALYRAKQGGRNRVETDPS